MYLTSGSNEMLDGCGKIGGVENFNRVSGGGGAMIDKGIAGPRDQERAECQNRTTRPKRRTLLTCAEPFKLSADDESDLIQMLNDPSSELYGLFSHHNTVKTPQQCYLDLKYSAPDDMESRSLYEKVMKYAQLHRKLGRRIKREKNVVKVKPMVAEASGSKKPAQQPPAQPGGKVEPITVAITCENKPASHREFVQEDGCSDRARKITAKHRTDKLCPRKAELLPNPLRHVKAKKPKKEVESEAEDAILKSYQKALLSKDMDSGLRLALLDNDCNRTSTGCGDGLGSCGLPSLLKGRHRSPPTNCFVTRPIRANRIQHSLSSVSSFEVLQTNTTCSVSSTSISISTCEVEDNHTVQDIMDKICSLEMKKRECRNTSVSPRDLSAIRKKQRGVLIEFTKERERQRRGLGQDNDACDPYAKLSPKKNKREVDEMSTSHQWSVPAAGSSRSNRTDLGLESCTLSASLFGNSAALKSLERKSGVSIEDLLKRRESDVAYRKQRAQELLKWHQRIAQEEDSVRQLETQLMNRGSCGKTMNSPNSSPRSEKLKPSVVGCSRTCECNSCCPPPPCCDPCNCCDPCKCCDPCQCKCRNTCGCGCCETGKQRCSGGGKPKKNRVDPENPPLCCKENCCCENCSRTYCISGRTLNKIWKDISGLPCDKYNNCFEYNLTDGDFEELYTVAKRERKIMRMGLTECTRCPEFDKEKERPKKQHLAWGENDVMGQTFGCSRGECEKDEEWSLMFHQPRHMELESAAPRPPMITDQKEVVDTANVTEEQKPKNISAARKLFDMFREPQGIYEIHKELNGRMVLQGDSLEWHGDGNKMSGATESPVSVGNENKTFLICEDNEVALEELQGVVDDGAAPNGLRSAVDEEEEEREGNKQTLTATEVISVGQKMCQEGSEQQKATENTPVEEVPVHVTFLCPSPTNMIPKEEEMVVEVLDLSTSKRRGDLLTTSGIVQPDQNVLRNLPPVPLSYIIKEVPSVEKVLGMLHRWQETHSDGNDQLWGRASLDLTNPYLRILSQEIPYLTEGEMQGAGEHKWDAQRRLENTVVDRLEQLRVYQLNLKRAHMGIGELVYEGPHYPHVQKIKDLVEYPQTEEDAFRTSGHWSPPYGQQHQEHAEKEDEHQRICEDSPSSGESMQRRYGAVQSPENRDRSYETEEGDYFDEEDEFLDYYSDMKYLKQSEQQILAIFTDHIMNSMLDDVVAVVQRNFPMQRKLHRDGGLD